MPLVTLLSLDSAGSTSPGKKFQLPSLISNEDEGENEVEDEEEASGNNLVQSPIIRTEHGSKGDKNCAEMMKKIVSKNVHAKKQKG